jgi:hypothetical protein
MKIKVCRMSGLPVELEDMNIYKDEFRRLYDKAERLCKQDMLRLNLKIVKIEKALQAKYPTVQDVDFPTTQESWKELQTKYGNILVSQHRHTGELLFVISDQEEVMYV